MENYQAMLKLCMWLAPTFTILATVSGFGWHYYGQKIKEQEKKETPQKKIDTLPKVQNTFHIKGDYVQGNKVTSKPKKQINAPNAIIVTQDQKGGQNTVNQYFGAKDPKHVVVEPTFEPAGSYGDNVLYEKHTAFAVGTLYSFNAKIPEHASLKVAMTRVQGQHIDNAWRMRVGTEKNWKHTMFKDEYQAFVLGDENGELEMRFMGKGSARVELFYNGKLLSSKTISWQ
jgi:hypothetical protein